MSLLTSREGGVLRLTLNRPEKRNALSTDLCSLLVQAIEGAWDDPSIRCVLLDAAGQSFCAGMDLEEVTEADAIDKTVVHERLFTLALRARKPMVAAAQGPALGGGLGLLANAQIVVASHGCSFGLTEVRVGMWPYVIWRSISAALGERKTMELSLTGRIFTVPEAVTWGMVSEAVPAIELDDRATAIAEHIASFSPLTVASGMHFVSQAREKGFEEAGTLAKDYRERAFHSADFAEGVEAFQQKRKPVWQGA